MTDFTPPPRPADPPAATRPPMRIVHGYPPNFSAIKEAFPAAVRPGVIFAWSDRIYNPSGGSLTPALMAHEGVHGERQDATEGGVTAWWDRYIADPQFRATEELYAHAAELRVLCAEAPSRQQRRLCLAAVAKRFASTLYGGVVSFEQAKALLKPASVALSLAVD